MTEEDEAFEALERRLKPKTTQPSQGWRKRQIEALKPREWVSLTNNEIALINADYPHPQGFARAIENKLKEKNHYT